MRAVAIATSQQAEKGPGGIARALFAARVLPKANSYNSSKLPFWQLPNAKGRALWRGSRNNF
jgi:hypothetical protein